MAVLQNNVFFALLTRLKIAIPLSVAPFQGYLYFQELASFSMNLLPCKFMEKFRDSLFLVFNSEGGSNYAAEADPLLYFGRIVQKD